MTIANPGCARSDSHPTPKDPRFTRKAGSLRDPLAVAQPSPLIATALNRVFILPIPLKPTRIYELMGDGTFPKPVRLGERAVAWLESEVDAWILTQADKPRAQIRTTSNRRKAAEAAAA
jgi:hypothetical protein